MNTYINLVDFIKTHKNWKELLSNPPYSINIKNNNPKHPDWYLFKYSQYATDFSYDVSKACRGVVLQINESGVKGVCIPFQKFFNLGEGNAAEIDWNNPVEVSLKYDGCLIKLSKFNGEINFFTNGSMETDVIASEAINNGLVSGSKTFQDLIDKCIEKHNASEWVKNIPEGITFMFELFGPENRIIVDYKESDLRLIGCYDHSNPDDPNSWFEYSTVEAKKKFNIPFEVPEFYSFKNIDDVISELETWGKDKEGVVIRDTHFNRVKIKSNQYRALKYAREGGFTDKGLYNSYFDGTLDDALAVWEDVKDKAEQLKEKMNDFVDWLNKKYSEALSEKNNRLTKKEVALKWKDLKCKNILFEGYDENHKTLKMFQNGELSFEKFQNYINMM